MKFKTAARVAGLVLSAALSVPVVSAITGHGHTSAAPVNQHPVGTSVCYFSGTTPPTGEIFANWTSHLHQYLLNFGINDSTEFNSENVGLRVDCDSSQLARSYQMDVNVTNGNAPEFSNFILVPGNSAPTFFGTAFLNNLPAGYTSTPLRGGFQRVRFNAANVLPSGAAFSSIYFEDSTDNVDSFASDSVENVFVNNVAMVPNIQATPSFDCTLIY